MASLKSSAIRDLLALTQQPHMISLAGGLPAPDSFPVESLRAVTDRAFAERPLALLQYSTTEGSPELREWVAEQATADRGGPVHADQVLITHGSQQALDLVAKVFIDPGVTVAIDEPGYVGAIQALSVFEPRFLPIPVDRHGMDVAVLADLLAAGERPRLVYTVVNFQNPSGSTLSLERRIHLGELADRYGFLVIEDDPYRALRFRGEQLPSVATFGKNVIACGTFSKLVVPGMRIGYVVAPSWLREDLAKVKQGADLHTSSFGQVLLSELVRQPGWIAEHTDVLVRIYGQRADALCDALERHVGDRLTFERPDGGMFLWASLTGDHTARELFTAALDAGVAFVPGDAFYTGEPDPRTLRLSFSTASPVELDEGARRLRVALDAVEGV